MAATYTYGVDADAVKGELPMDASNVGATGGKIQNDDLTGWISNGAAKFNGLLKRSGISPSASMDADAHEIIASGVKGYAVMMACGVLGITGTVYTDARDRFQTAYAEYSNRPQSLGTAYSDGFSTSVDNVETPDDWGFIDSEGNIW